MECRNCGLEGSLSCFRWLPLRFKLFLFVRIKVLGRIGAPPPPRREGQVRQVEALHKVIPGVRYYTRYHGMWRAGYARRCRQSPITNKCQPRRRCVDQLTSGRWHPPSLMMDLQNGWRPKAPGRKEGHTYFVHIHLWYIIPAEGM